MIKMVIVSTAIIRCCVISNQVNSINKILFFEENVLFVGRKTHPSTDTQIISIRYEV